MELQTLRIEKIIKVLRKITKNMTDPMISTIINEYGKNPYLILISCLLSLRSRDTITLPVCNKLFKIAKTPEQMLKIPLSKLEDLIYPVGFYKKKAKLLHSISKTIIKEFNSKVPTSEKELLSINGIGRKTANLVLSQAFDIPAICVDTHVHKISNLLGIVKTKTPLDTEISLKKILPIKYWTEWNTLLVKLGQNYRGKQLTEIINQIKSS